MLLCEFQLTKLKEDVKAKLEDDFRSGGQRTASQVSNHTDDGFSMITLCATN